MLGCEHLSRATHTALNFIEHKQYAVFVADAAQPFKKTLRRRHITALALHRLDDDRRDFCGRRRGFEQEIFDPI